MSKLALLGGDPVRVKPFPAYNVIGADEIDAVRAVMETGVLSRFLGTWHADFYGGPQVQAFEKEWAATCGVEHAVAVNSATSGLYAAVGAAGVGPGDEVIVPPLSMTASATAAVIYGGVPVFCDIDPGTFNPSPDSIRDKVTSRTRAIMVVHLLGHPADMDPIMAVAAERGLTVIEDCAQALSAAYKGRPVGAIGHIGVFSLNYHKHIHTGEGGVCTSNDARLADRIRLIRNHAEAVVAGKGETDLVNMVGFNYRLGEIEAAIGRSLLPKGVGLVDKRRHNVAYLEQRLGDLPGLAPARAVAGCRHSYYAHAFHCDETVHGVSRDLMVRALRAELPPTEMRDEAGGALIGGYKPPLYLFPMYQKQIGFGGTGFPFKGPHYSGKADYAEGLCPAAEHAARTMITHELMRPPMTKKDLNDVVAAFHKVFDNLPSLRDYAD
ncbi:MAG: DegT/DnrJ/EryC1/StrS aminotransferase [Rhodospirillales bacterium RIFCSPLOWO2_12_FULL_58_28]|nr:MAG: DegT/DnrJ/EryC1/StrS aminotransferase [Rhodospirillales bacterium RIFCSPLOWO2_02_FULL_58_16]OHC79769.1 MAG: DegT/DnrJ/EryC1/StrS aminotransferase [Rhodospirillales bacterium RIFCSPLOWO2_12_FULL_58_28]